MKVNMGNYQSAVVEASITKIVDDNEAAIARGIEEVSDTLDSYIEVEAEKLVAEEEEEVAEDYSKKPNRKRK
jgi:hypothetical protein